MSKRDEGNEEQVGSAPLGTLRITGVSVATQRGRRGVSFRGEPIVIREGDVLSVAFGGAGVVVRVDSASLLDAGGSGDGAGG